MNSMDLRTVSDLTLPEDNGEFYHNLSKHPLFSSGLLTFVSQMYL